MAVGQKGKLSHECLQIRSINHSINQGGIWGIWSTAYDIITYKFNKKLKKMEVVNSNKCVTKPQKYLILIRHLIELLSSSI